MTIRERRKRLGLNQIQVAEKLGLQQSYYSRVERGRENPTIGVFVKLSDLYEAEVDELVREWLEVRSTLNSSDEDMLEYVSRMMVTLGSWARTLRTSANLATAT